MKTRRLMILAIVLAAVLILPVGANACWINITATNATGSETLKFTDADLAVGFEGAILDGFIDKLVLSGKADPEIGTEFGVRAGNSVTTFTITSGVESFGDLINPDAYASAGVTLTDKPSVVGAKITGLYAGGKTNQALYNGTTAWANLVSTFSVPIGQTTQTMDEQKGNELSMITINDTLTSIESNFKFTLTAKDSASGTSTFVVTPEPATICLLGLGALSLLRRRKNA